MRARVFHALDWIRRRARRDGALVRIVEPLLRLLAIERGAGRPTWSFIRRRGLTVLDGPFAGLRYPRSEAVHIPGLAGRIGGTYEAELRPAVERLIAADPALIVNAGAGDGLYAVGMALRCPAASVIAYELDPYAARVCRAVARHNGVDARLTLRGACTVAALEQLPAAERTVFLCDCEGAERELVDPQRVPWLARAPLLIEVHESFAPGLERELSERLRATHTVELIEPQRRYLEDHPPFWDIPGVTLLQLESLMAELRPWRTPWLLGWPRDDGPAAAQG